MGCFCCFTSGLARNLEICCCCWCCCSCWKAESSDWNVGLAFNGMEGQWTASPCSISFHWRFGSLKLEVRFSAETPFFTLGCSSCSSRFITAWFGQSIRIWLFLDRPILPSSCVGLMASGHIWRTEKPSADRLTMRQVVTSRRWLEHIHHNITSQQCAGQYRTLLGRIWDTSGTLRDAYGTLTGRFWDTVRYKSHDASMTLLWRFYDAFMTPLWRLLGRLLDVYGTLLDMLLGRFYDASMTLLWRFCDAYWTIFWRFWDVCWTFLGRLWDTVGYASMTLLWRLLDAILTLLDVTSDIKETRCNKSRPNIP